MIRKWFESDLLFYGSWAALIVVAVTAIVLAGLGVI